MDMAEIATHHISPFNYSSFSSPVLLRPPRMDPRDEQLFANSLKANTTTELVSSFRLWEDKLLRDYPDEPFFLVRVADVRASLSSGATALLLYREAQKLIPKDPTFDEFIEHFERQCVIDEDDHRARWSHGMFNQPWRSTSKFLFPIIPVPPETMPELQTRWQILKTRPGDRRLKYFRYLCIETNVLEQTFLLEPESIDQLVRIGYVEKDTKSSSESSMRDQAHITSILRDTHKALDMIWMVANDTEKFTAEFLIELHRICLHNCKILPVKKTKEDGETYEALKFTNVGTTRQASRKNVIIPGPPRVQFAPFENVVDEIRRITHLGRQWLKNWSKNPFATAAWLHVVFVSCHPFEDGNGRVARLVASIPLVKAGLPPLSIPAAAKKDYYEGLNKAVDNNYEPLIRCFVESLEASLSAIENIEHDPDMMTII